MDFSDARPPVETPPTPVGLRHHFLALLVAPIGGALGILGAFVQELRSGGGILLPFVGAPIIEEGLKPLGVYILLLRWPRLLRGQLHTALLTGLAGLAFGVIESASFVALTSHPSDAFIAYRFTAPLLVHSTASFIVGLGLNRKLLAWAQGQAPLPRASRNLFFAGVVLHALFNTITVVLAIAGVLDLD